MCGRDGVMEAAAKGARDAGGITVGILPGFSKEEANEYIDIAIPTGLSHARNAINVLAGDVVIAIHGGVGTLSEIGLALAYGKPVIAIKTSGGVSELLADKVIAGRKIYSANNAKEAIELAIKLINKTERTL